MNARIIAAGALVVFLATQTVSLKAQDPKGQNPKPKEATAPPPANEHALVPDGKTVRPEAPSENGCDTLDPKARAAAYTESQERAARLLIASLSLARRYEEVRQAPALQNLGYINDANDAKVARSLYNAYLEYLNSSAEGRSSASAQQSSAYAVPAGLITFGTLVRIAPEADAFAKTSGTRMGIAGSLSIVSIASAKPIFRSVLKTQGGELSIEDQKKIKTELEETTGEAAQFLSNTLKWTPSERSKFEKAVRARVLSTLQGVLNDRPEFETSKSNYGGTNETRKSFAVRLLALLNQINYVDIISEQGLASPFDLSALKDAQDVFDRSQKLRDAGLSESAAKEILGPNADVERNLEAIIRLNRLMAKVQKEVGPGVKMQADLAKLIQETDEAVATIKKLCDLGL